MGRGQPLSLVEVDDGFDLATNVPHVGVILPQDQQQTLFEQSRGQELLIEFGFPGRRTDESAPHAPFAAR